MKKHLIAISKIIKTFKDNWKFNEAYLQMDGEVNYNSSSRVNVKCNSEFDHISMIGVKQIQADLYNQIQHYLKINNITSPLFIITNQRGWAKAGQTIFFKEEMSC